VGLVAGLMRRWKGLDRAARRRLLGEVLKFGAVGAFDTVLHFGLFNLLLRAGWEPLLANGLANMVAITSAYLLNRYWTFAHRARSGVGREFTIFVIVNGIGWLISQACVGFTRYLLGLTDPLALNAALVAGVALGTIFRFTTYKRFVFLSPERAELRLARRAARARRGEPGWTAERPAADTIDD
jgi:putative flippase GtrA